MKFVSPMLKHVVYPALARTGYLRRHANPGPTVVTYHGVLPAGYEIIDPYLDGNLVSASSFRRQLRFLKKYYNVISPDQFLHWCQSKASLPQCSVLLTCDDGLQNTLTEMVPVLREEGLSCLFFITGASLAETSSMLWYDELYLMMLAAPEPFTLELPELAVRSHTSGRREKRVLWWELVKVISKLEMIKRGKIFERMRDCWGLSETWGAAYREEPSRRCRFFMLDIEGLKQLSVSGMSIGSHTCSHMMLSQLPSELAWNEISKPRQTFEQALGRPIWAMAYPFGDVDSAGLREMEMAERAGYSCAFVNHGGNSEKSNALFSLPRTHVSREMNLAEFEAHISGFYQRMRHSFGV